MLVVAESVVAEKSVVADHNVEIVIVANVVAIIV